MPARGFAANLPGMIEMGNPTDAVDPAVLDAPGGFAWWYADVITPEGDGLVLIWSYGLPFLPGYADSARRGYPERPLSRPSVNIAVYRAGKEVAYLLQEYPETPFGATDAQVIGGCRFERQMDGGRCRLDVTLDCPVPGTRDRLMGTVRVEGAVPILDTGIGLSTGAHLWTPLAAPATASVSLDVGADPVVRIAGRAYHDCNTGLHALHDLGIERWMWGRFPFADGERIYYLLWPSDGGEARCLGLTVGRDGSMREAPGLTAELFGEQRTRFGLRHPGRIRLQDGGLWLDVHHRATVDSGPFYLRFQSEAVLPGGERVLGWGELCEPARVDLRRFRSLVRMRVHQTAAPNSLWLPLFSGPRQDRLARLIRHALARTQ